MLAQSELVNSELQLWKSGRRTTGAIASRRLFPSSTPTPTESQPFRRFDRPLPFNAKLVALGLVGAVAITSSADEPFGSESAAYDETAIKFERQLRAKDSADRQLEINQALKRSVAHAQMPSTMYASTPSDPSKVPHTAPGWALTGDSIVDLVMSRYFESMARAETKPLSQRWKRVVETIKLVNQSRIRQSFGRDRFGIQHTDSSTEISFFSRVNRLNKRHVLPYFPTTSDPYERQGTLRLVNRTSRRGVVTIQAIDEYGQMPEPITLTIDAAATFQLNSEELEFGNFVKGLVSGTGPGRGSWTLRLSSNVSIEAVTYIETPDGFLASVHDTAPQKEDDAAITYLLSSNDGNQRSLLRLVNLNAVAATAFISIFDERGHPSPRVTVELPARHARTYSHDDLTTGMADGLSGFLSDGRGTLRLRVQSDPGVLAMSLIENNNGHLASFSNSSARNRNKSVSFFLSASDAYRRQGMLRIVNLERLAGEVTIHAFDDSGRAYETISLQIDSSGIAEFDSNDLELGNPAKGLLKGTGAGVGNWRLELLSDLDLDILSSVRTPDGFLTPMQDTVLSNDNSHYISMFKAADKTSHFGLLRLINAGSQPANVTIHGVDDSGLTHGTARLTVAPNASRTLNATELEEGGEDLDGMLGNGTGDWRLAISSNAPVEVMNLLSTPTGHLTNLSTSISIASDNEETAESVFERQISPLVQSMCINCHVAGGASQNTRLVFVGDDDNDHLKKNLAEFQGLLEEVDDGANYILDKIQGISHGGGQQVTAGTDEFAAMARFLELLGEDVATGPTVSANTLFDGVTLEPYRQTLRRAAIVFAGRVPTDDEYSALVDGDETRLRSAIREMLQGPGFHEFLIRASNDRLFTDRDIGSTVIDANRGNFPNLTNESYRLALAAHSSDDVYQQRKFREWQRDVQYGFGRAPLELIAHVVENDLPYTEILTADYIMANELAAEAYGSPTRFEDEDDVHTFRRSSIDAYYRKGDGYVEENVSGIGKRVLDPGPLLTDYPHAGILNTTVFLDRYPTTATNRNRARSRWTYYHFLGLDIEKSASRTTDAEALADTNNPTMRNPACTVCHTVLDPVAGAFQNYGDEGLYRDQYGGMDSLDRFYKDHSGTIEDFEVTATSFQEAQSISASEWLKSGRNVVRLRPYFDPPKREDEDIWWNMAIDRVTVVSADGETVDSVEVETLGLDCGRQDPVIDEMTGEQYYEAWFCEQHILIEVSAEGTYEIRVMLWIQAQHDEVSQQRRLVEMRVGGYQDGDTWYRDMRDPGFDGELATKSQDSLRWLANQIVNDERFATATVKFWWTSVLGFDVVEPPASVEDTADEATLLASAAQAQEVERLASGFETGFSEGNQFNLKDLLVEIALSPWFRANSIENDETVRIGALRQAGAHRLLTPEELASKTHYLTGFQWGRDRDRWWRAPHEENVNWLTDPERGYRLMYGGIDSDGITQRARELNSMMAGVAQSHAAESACPIVMREFFLLRNDERLLFNNFGPEMTPKWEFSEVLEIEGASQAGIDTFSVSGFLSAGEVRVKLAFINDYWSASEGDRDILLDRIRVFSENRVVLELEMEDHEHEPKKCYHTEQDALHLSRGGPECVLTVAFDIPVADTYAIEVDAWGDQAGDEAPQLALSVESDVERSEGSKVIRAKLAELYNKLHGLNLTADSAKVQSAYALFVNVWEMNLESDEASTDFRRWKGIQCNWYRDKYFLDGILEGSWIFREDWGDEKGPRHDWNWELIDEYFETVNFSDREGVARTWVAVMAYLLMDYSYLYL